MGDTVTAEQALGFGLINRVVPDEEVTAAARAMAARMAENGPLAMRKAKQVMLESVGASILEGFAAEDQAIKTVLRSKDAREGSRAFTEKRAPQFTGV
jgi:enoyl-CoA hydratase/carnithine racemase